MVTRILICSDAGNLAKRLRDFPATATVNAEYGKEVVEGNIRTLARPSCRCPSMPMGVDAIGCATFGIDTLGGILAILGEKAPENGCEILQDMFWDLVAHCCCNGVHKLSDWISETRRRLGSTESDACASCVAAYWALEAAFNSIASSKIVPVGNDVLDITDTVNELRRALHSIFKGNTECLANGEVYRDAQFALNQSSFKGLLDGRVIVRSSTKPVSHIYRAPNGILVNRVVVFDPISGLVSISIDKSEFGINCRDLAVSLWGEESTGNEFIASSPPGMKYTMRDALKVARQLSSM